MCNVFFNRIKIASAIITINVAVEYIRKIISYIMVRGMEECLMDGSIQDETINI